MNVTDLTQAIQGGLIQQDRLVKTDIPSLPANTMVPCRVLTASELGRDFSVTLDMISTAGDVELKAVIAQPMSLWIQQADKSYLVFGLLGRLFLMLCGVIARLILFVSPLTALLSLSWHVQCRHSYIKGCK